MSTAEAMEPARGRPDILVRIGLLTKGRQVVGADGPHPDTKLLAMIERYTALTDRRGRLWDLACKYSQNGKRHKELTKEAFRFHDEIEGLETKIATTPTKTLIGAITKVSLVMAEIDPMGEGISKRGTQFRLALSALIDAKTMLEADRS